MLMLFRCVCVSVFIPVKHHELTTSGRHTNSFASIDNDRPSHCSNDDVAVATTGDRCASIGREEVGLGPMTAAKRV